MTVRLYAVFLVLATASCLATLEIQDEHLGAVLDTIEVKPGPKHAENIDLVNYEFQGTKMLDYDDIFRPEEFNP